MAMTSRGALQILELGMLDLAIDLRQALLAAHGEHGVAECHENSKTSPEPGTRRVPFRKPSASVLNFEVGHGGGGGR